MTDKITSKDQVELKPGDAVWVPAKVVKVGQVNANCNLTLVSCEKNTNMVLHSSEVIAKLPSVQKFSFDEASLTAYAKHAVSLIQIIGSPAIDLIRVGFEGFKQASGRDFPGLFATLNDGKKDVKAIAEAIKAEFKL